jgi:hypothetical protein
MKGFHRSLFTCLQWYDVDSCIVPNRGGYTND